MSILIFFQGEDLCRHEPVQSNVIVCTMHGNCPSRHNKGKCINILNGGFIFIYSTSFLKIQMMTQFSPNLITLLI